MMSNDPITPATVTGSTGAQLRAAREALGMSQESVAQQLKLAPRQVRAIEEDDYARLPGRTFVRGFVRNYARLVHLDAGAVVAGLPRVDGTSPLDRPSLTAASRPMAELPAPVNVRRSAPTRWLIPVVLLAIVAVAGFYEYARTPSPPRRVAVENAAPAQSAPVAAGQKTTALPNPFDGSKTDAASATSSAGTTSETPVAPTTAVAPIADATQAGTNLSSSNAPTAVAPATPAPGSSDAALVLTFKDKSWVEVKDANGAPIFTQTGAAGTTQTVNGTPPFDVAIGNAAGVGVTFRGQPIDITAFTHANIARFSLR